MGAEPSFDPRIALGHALSARADDVARDVAARLASSGLDALTRVKLATADRLATRLIARWLITGRTATDDEAQRLAQLGSMANVLSLDRLVKSHLAWRDATLVALEQEADRLGVGRRVRATARTAIQRSCDVSLVRMARHVDAERRRLEAELAAQQAELAHQALHDALTGLANRTLLGERMAHALHAATRHGARIGVLFVDLDEFKAVNDTLGHGAGDRLLLTVAARLTQIVRPSDTVARMGGDEFVVLCERLEHGHEEAVAIAERVLERVGRPCPLGDQEARVSASVGVAVAGAGADPDAVLKQADIAMYAAKRAGGARWADGAPAPS